MKFNKKILEKKDKKIKENSCYDTIWHTSGINLQIKNNWLDSYRNKKVDEKLSVLKSVDEKDEWLAEVYLKTNFEDFNEEDFVKTIHNYVGFKFASFKLTEISRKKTKNEQFDLKSKKWMYFKLNDIFSQKKRGKRLTEEDREKGNLLYFSASEFNNGWTDTISNPLFIEKDALIYTTFGDSFYIEGEFTASDEITIFKHKTLNIFNGLFLATVISKNKYKYSFGRKAFQNKWISDLIPLPVNEKNLIDWKFMEDYIKSLPYSSSLS